MINFLFTLLIFLLPFGVVLRISIFPNVYVYPIDIIAIILFVTYIIQLLKKRKLEYLNIFYPLLGFIGIGLFSLLLDLRYLTFNQFLVSFLYLLRFIVYVSLIWSVARIAKDKNLNVKLLVTGALFIIFGFIQYFYYNNLRNLYYLGWDDHLYRLFSTFLDPNFAGAFLSLIFIFSLGLAIDFYRKKKKILLWLTSFVGTASLIALFLTYSRSALIMLVVGLIVFFILNKFIKQLFVVLVSVLILYVLFANTKIEGLNPFRIASSEARLSSASQAIDIFSKNPVFGVGFDSFRYTQVRYGTRTHMGSAASNADAGTDNSFLFVLVTTGVVGFVFFLKFLFEIGNSLFKMFQKGKSIFASVAISSFIAILVNSFFINSLFYIFIMSWVFIVIGISLSRKQ